MSVNGVAMFYGKVATDMMLRNEFAKFMSDSIRTFARERGYFFTEHDLQVSGKYLQGFAKLLENDVKSLQAMQRAAAAAVNAATKVAAKKAIVTPPPPGMGPLAVPPGGMDPAGIMAGMQMDTIYRRLADVFAGMSGSKKKSG